jgi:hypothetical protein
MASKIPGLPSKQKSTHLSKVKAKKGIYGKGGLQPETKGGLGGQLR